MKTKEIAMYILGAFVVVGFFIVLIFLILQAKSESTVNILVGVLAGAFGTVVGYFFGSSKGSADKTELLNAKTDKP